MGALICVGDLMMVGYPEYTKGIIRLLCRCHGMHPNDAVRWVGDNDATVWERYGRNRPEAHVAAELKEMNERRREKSAGATGALP